jgi:hypothetical protein
MPGWGWQSKIPLVMYEILSCWIAYSWMNLSQQFYKVSWNAFMVYYFKYKICKQPKNLQIASLFSAYFLSLQKKVCLEITMLCVCVCVSVRPLSNIWINELVFMKIGINVKPTKTTTTSHF